MTYSSHKKINELEVKTSLFNTDVLVFADLTDNGRAKQISFQDFLSSIQNNTSLANLNDVSLSTPTSGQGLIYDGANWTNQDIATRTELEAHISNTNNPHQTSLSNLTDTNITNPSDGQILTYDATSSKWVVSAPSQGATQLGQLNDVSLNTPTNGQHLVFDGTNWTNQDATIQPSGTDKQLQFNDNGAIGGADVYYDKSTQSLGISTTNPTHKLEVNGDASFRQPISQKTSNYSILASDSNTLFHNNTATGQVTLTLPAIQDGLVYEFLIKTAQTLTITGADTIRYGTVTGTNLSATDAGNHIKLTGVAGEWIVTQITGQWDLV